MQGIPGSAGHQNLKPKRFIGDANMVEKYTVTIWWSERDNRFLAAVPDLPGCFADGPTQEAALSAIHRIASEWIDVASEVGMAIPCPKPYFAPELEQV